MKPEDITWRCPEVVVRLNHDPGLHIRQRQRQSTDFLQWLIGKNDRCQSIWVARAADAQILWPDSQGDFALPINHGTGEDGQHQPRLIGEEDHCLVFSAPLEAPVQQVHPRLSHEIGDEQIGWCVIDLVGGADLLENPAVHHRDPVSQGKRFMLIVCDQHRRVAGLALEVLQLAPGLLAL